MLKTNGTYKLQITAFTGARASTLQRVFASGRCFCAETEASAATLMKECSRVCLWHKQRKSVYVGHCCRAGAALAVMARVGVRLTVFWPDGSVQVNYTEKNVVFVPSLLLLVIFCRLCKRNSRNPGFSKETCHSVNVFEARALDIIYVRGG